MEDTNNMEITPEITSEWTRDDICKFLEYFSTHTYAVGYTKDEPRSYMTDALKLMERDYKIERIENRDGTLCPQYPEIIPIIESPRQVTTIYENEEEVATTPTDIEATKAYFNGAKLARCRQRFVIPVIMINGKYICRSSTLASELEMCYRTGQVFRNLSTVKELWWPCEGLAPEPETYDEQLLLHPAPYENDYKAATICAKAREFDIKLLQHFNVNTIVDIMVEKRKVKHGCYVTSSEKVVKNRYSSNFQLLGLPYPGCEFFKSYHDALFNPEGLVYDWNNPANDAILSLPDDSINRNLAIPWQQYKEWDLALITQNYLKYILKRIQEDQSGLLLHCISGWDRTPLFISLIRLSLWADSLIHTSLNEHEILYFTLIYDWYLFGHHLHNRVYKNEEIMAFCFDFLKYIVSDDFSLRSCKKKLSDETKYLSDDSHSPSKASSTSASSDEIYVYKKKKSLDNAPIMEASENFNYFPMDIPYEDRPPRLFNLEGECVDPPYNGEDSRFKTKILSPTSVAQKRTSPIPVAGTTASGGTPSRRQRSESTSSNNSNVSWQLISESGSVEKDQLVYRSQRQQRLESVRSLFNSCYQRTVKKESFGPPQRWFYEEIAVNISQIANWSRWLDLPGLLGDVPNNGNEEKMDVPNNGIEEKNDLPTNEIEEKNNLPTNGNEEKNETAEETNGNDCFKGYVMVQNPENP